MSGFFLCLWSGNKSILGICRVEWQDAVRIWIHLVVLNNKIETAEVSLLLIKEQVWGKKKKTNFLYFIFYFSCCLQYLRGINQNCCLSHAKYCIVNEDQVMMTFIQTSRGEKVTHSVKHGVAREWWTDGNMSWTDIITPCRIKRKELWLWTPLSLKWTCWRAC